MYTKYMHGNDNITKRKKNKLNRYVRTQARTQPKIYAQQQQYTVTDIHYNAHAA